ncbi:MAG: hypothetical protein ACD_49C00023G0010 [uncultured bacterium (gcode 4)]|uniref:Uncharacterized protein n=1 Tax=uncultured bacterium (gcode 4) TaxID=1234023 RepID=K2AY84_9BACT|nr:MAG: hypothetical protein ACD_49C00023G0010 [uncultured bacterium (gcode 4)]
MNTFKVICAKNNQKVELIVQYNSLDEAKQHLHSQWYSIIDIQEISENLDNSGIFYFEAIINSEKKSGKIKSNDIFKAYLKLVDDLHYDIIYIYDQKDLEENEKIIITQKVKETYKIYKWSQKTKKVDENKKSEEKKEIKSGEISEIVLKELNYYYNLIDNIIEKIDYIFTTYSAYIDPIKKEKLNQIYTALKQVKNITNVSKLKSIWELSLLKIWEFEKELIINNSTLIKKDILKNTNKLLKNFWSKQYIQISDQNYSKIIVDIIKGFFKEKFDTKNNEKVIKIDKNSYAYLKIIKELNTYKEKLKELQIKKVKAMALFDKENLKRLSIKEKLVKQNISLSKNRLTNNNFSYTKIVKWFSYYNKIILFLIQKISDLFIYSIFFYSIFFLIIRSTNIGLNYNFLYIIVLFSGLGFILKISKNLYFLSFGTLFYIMFFIYLSINF